MNSSNDTSPNYDLSENDLDPECDYIIHKDLITKVTEVNEEGESSSDNQEPEDNIDSNSNSEMNNIQYNDKKPSWNRKGIK